VASDHAFWIRVLLRAASRRATDEELGDVMEAYAAGRHGAAWLVSQVLSIIRRQRSPLTVSERGAEMLSNTWNDIRYALRTLRRNPGFAVAAIVPIALGIGINTGVFAILNSVAWRPLPVPDSGELVSVYQDFRGGPRRMVNGARALFSMPEYRVYHSESHTFSGLMAYSRQWTVTLGRDAPREVDGILVTCNYFDVLEVSPVIGSGLTPAHCGAADAPPVVVLSHALWQSMFAGDPRILSKPIVMNGRDVLVVGVTPPGFDGIDMGKAAFFAPTSLASVLHLDQNLEHGNVSWLTIIGRRRGDADIAKVRADLSVIAARIDREQPGRTTSLIVQPAASLSLPPARKNILRGAGIVMVGFGLVLLIAACNVANILLARATARRSEIAVRLSLGATRGRIVRQLLTESAMIALAGAACGALLFSWAFETLLPLLLSSIPGADPFRIDATPDRTVVWFALGLTATTTLVFGLVPSLQASRGVYGQMKQDTGRRGWGRGALIGAQVAVCTLLLIPAALLSRALYAAHTLDAGFNQEHVAIVSIDLRDPRYEKGNAAIFYEHWLERAKAVPGVESIAFASRIPLSPGRSQTTFRIGDEANGQTVEVNTVSPNFFSVLGIPIVRGRVFDDREPDSVVVTEATARRYWPGQDAVGRTITMDGRARYIVGIARDVLMSQDRDATSSYMYLPAIRGTQRRISVLARTAGDFDGFAAAVRAETSRMDSGLVVNVRPLTDNLGLLQTLSQITAGVAAALSLLSLGLAAIGVYGVVAYVVSRRWREVGIRVALGADARDVQRLILYQTLRPVAIGIVIGIAVAPVLVRVLRAVLFGVSPYDPVAFIAAPLLMLTIAAAAASMPIRRASRVDPVSILRSE
jgi:predicted permease